MAKEKNNQPISLLICALGGEGGGVLAEWIVSAARDVGFPAQSTSIPGVAQRTGATTYYIEIYPEVLSNKELTPVFSLYPVPGQLDLLVSSELLETARQVSNGMTTVDRTEVITSNSRVYTNREKLHLADGRLSVDDLLSKVQQSSRKLIAFDMAEAVSANNTVMSAVLMGAIAASDVIPIDKINLEAVIKRSGRGVEASINGFEYSYEKTLENVNRRQTQTDRIEEDHSVSQIRFEGLDFIPVKIQKFIELGIERTAKFQNKRYAQQYYDRILRIANKEKTRISSRINNFRVTEQISRNLAVWMCFDDIVKVASLKSSPERYRRIRSEVKANQSDLVLVRDFFKPGLPEIAGLLPSLIANPLNAYRKKRERQGKPELSFPLKIRSDGPIGFTLLRFLSWLKWLRPFGIRYKDEQRLIEKWLSAVEKVVAENEDLGVEVARSAKLIKGYGSTNDRGRGNLIHILDNVLSSSTPPTFERSEMIKKIIDAAFADEDGRELDAVLSGAQLTPRTEVPSQPIYWHKSRVKKN